MKRYQATLAGAVLGLALVTPCLAQDKTTTTKPDGTTSTTTTAPDGTTTTTTKPAPGRLNSAVESLKRGALQAEEAVKSGYAQARESVHNMNTSSRVYSRLHWDKALNGAKIDIAVKDDGVTTLTGSVADAIARAKAVELARDTVGVTQVVDQLTIGSPSTTTEKTTVTTPEGTTTTVKEKTTKP